MKRALFSIMLIGIVAIGATVGGLAAFNDTEKSSGNTFIAGDLDLKIDWVQYWNGELIENQPMTDLDEAPIFKLDDVKPGDNGEATISLHVYTNDAWVCMELNPISEDDVSSNEPELLVDDPDNEFCPWDGELAQVLKLQIWQENDGNNFFDDGERILYEGTASNLPYPVTWFNLDQNLDTSDGIQPLIGCENYYVGISWSIDPMVGNEIQSDEFAFDMTFYAYQYRHQEDDNPCENERCVNLETLYLSDSGVGNNDGVGTKLFRVDLNDVENRAYLTQMTQLNAENFDQCDAIACSADGENIYLIDKFSKHLGIYNVLSNTFIDRGAISGLPDGLVLAAFSPVDNELYVASDDTDMLYTIDIGTPSATSVGLIPKAGGGNLDIMGADLVFDATGVLYIWVNSSPPGLWRIDDLDNIEAELMGTPDDVHYFTGLAIRAAGTGTLVGSTNSGPIWEVDPSGDVTIGTEFETYVDSDPYTVGYGDMTVGMLCVFLNGDN